MTALLVIMVVLAINSIFLEGGSEGLKFYLLPSLDSIREVGDGNLLKGFFDVIVGAMNQAFFTLSLGIGSMAIFGSYLNKDRSLLGEAINVSLLDTFVAITSGLIIFPACFSFDVSPDAGPNLLFVAMAKVFNHMPGGRWWGALFFLFMVFAAMSTIIAVFENILACVRELTGWSRKKGCIICGTAILFLSVPCALGFNLWSGFHPFTSTSNIMDLEDFLVSNCLLPLGALCYELFCVTRYGWGFDNFLAEANTGKGLKLHKCMKPYFTYVLPTVIAVIFFIGIFTFPFADNFTLWDWLKGIVG